MPSPMNYTSILYREEAVNSGMSALTPPVFYAEYCAYLYIGGFVILHPGFRRGMCQFKSVYGKRDCKIQKTAETSV